MEKGKAQIAAERPAFHFPPVNGKRPPVLRFHVYACLPSGSRAHIGSTTNRADAEALTRLISPASGIRVEIEGREELS